MEVVPDPEVLFRWSSARFNACKFGGEVVVPGDIGLGAKKKRERRTKYRESTSKG